MITRIQKIRILYFRKKIQKKMENLIKLIQQNLVLFNSQNRSLINKSILFREKNHDLQIYKGKNEINLNIANGSEILPENIQDYLTYSPLMNNNLKLLNEKDHFHSHDFNCGHPRVWYDEHFEYVHDMELHYEIKNGNLS